VVQLLLKKGANAAAMSRHGFTPLRSLYCHHWQTCYEHKAVARLLFSRH
jgi:hypothetical protein